ncbi:SigE family RNA polymerase sigma factor [Nocardioides sp. CPCC 205120]|uniref:SigE family RNA polymerase sigma factor n=1 Tax=Nocardioides sp. CPCC 205120 TaxID=3406462 RepID=UPI003B5088D6
MERDRDFSEFVAARWGVLVRSGVMLGCDVEEAHDLAQTTLLKCYKGWRKLQEAGDRDAYVYRMLLNSHRDNRRRRWWGERPTEVLPEVAAPDFASGIDTVDAVRRALGELNKISREVIVLRYYGHLSEQQTAEILGVAPGTVKSRLSRALAQLAVSSHFDDFSEGRTR